MFVLNNSIKSTKFTYLLRKKKSGCIELFLLLHIFVKIFIIRVSEKRLNKTTIIYQFIHQYDTHLLSNITENVTIQSTCLLNRNHYI